MKVGKVELTNFASYSSLSFDYSDLGLSLISGDTGSGKSTMLDAVSWILFGNTGKDGAADDVKPWGSDEGVTGTAEVMTPSGDITIVRDRSHRNDLYWIEAGATTFIRGKDLTDTQRLLDTRLGCTEELFLLGSYLTQFSKADSFFIAKAKDRREVLEKIADQEFAIDLGEKASSSRKIAKKDRDALDLCYSKILGRAETLIESFTRLDRLSGSWETQQALKLEALSRRRDNFAQEQQDTISAMQVRADKWRKDRSEKIVNLKELIDKYAQTEEEEVYAEVIRGLKAKLADLKDTRCSACGSMESSSAKAELTENIQILALGQRDNDGRIRQYRQHSLTLKDILGESDPYEHALVQANHQPNPYADQLIAAQREANPYSVQLQDCVTALTAAEKDRQDLEGQLAAKEALIASLTWIYDKSFEFRSLLMTRVVSQVEQSTNSYLEKHFDAALRVRFILADSDKLEIEISNDGNPCPFKSLSGGERTILKLAFSLSLMRAAQDKSGISFGMIMLDEPFNGLSDSLKVKAFGLLRQLESEYPTVLVIEHSSELKSQFDNAYLVEKIGGHSSVSKQS